MCSSRVEFSKLILFSNLAAGLGFPDSSVGKESPAMQETSVQFLGHEDPLETG